MQTVKIFRVYGAEGHRQRESFYRSYVSDISRPNSPRSIEVRNSDKTGTNDFSILQIVGESDIDCYTELQLQLSTGAFECSKVGDVYEILADGLCRHSQKSSSANPKQAQKTTQKRAKKICVRVV